MKIVFNVLAFMLLLVTTWSTAQKRTFTNVKSYSGDGISAIKDHSGKVRGYYLLFKLEKSALIKPRETPHRIEFLDTLLNSIGGVDLVKDENYHIMSVTSTKTCFVFLLSRFDAGKIDKAEMELLTVDMKTMQTKSVPIVPNEFEKLDITRTTYGVSFGAFDEMYLFAVGDGILLKRKNYIKKVALIELNYYGLDLIPRWKKELEQPNAAFFTLLGEDNGVLHYYITNLENLGSIMKPKYKYSYGLKGIELRTGNVTYNRLMESPNGDITLGKARLVKGQGIIVNTVLTKKGSYESPEGVGFGESFFDLKGNTVSSKYVFVDDIKGGAAAALKESIKKMNYNVLLTTDAGENIICVDILQKDAYDLHFYKLDSTNVVVSDFVVERTGELIDLPNAFGMNNRAIQALSRCDYTVATNRSKAAVNLFIVTGKSRKSNIHEWTSLTIGKNVSRKNFTAGSEDYPSYIVHNGFEKYLIIEYKEKEKVLQLEIKDIRY